MSSDELPKRYSSVGTPVVGTYISDVEVRGLRTIMNPSNEFGVTKNEITTGIVTSYGILLTGNESVLVPHELLSEARVWMVGKDRTKENWKFLLVYLKSKIGKLPVEHDRQSPCIIFTAALAFVTDIDLEVMAGIHISSKWDDIQKLSLLGTKPFASLGAAVLLGAALGFLGCSSVFAVIIRNIILKKRLWANRRALYDPTVSWWQLLGDLSIGVSGAVTTFWAAYWFKNHRPVNKSRSPINALDHVPHKYSTSPQLVEELVPKITTGQFLAIPIDWRSLGKKVLSYVPFVTVNDRVPIRCSNDTPTQMHSLIVRMLGGVEHSVFDTIPTWLDLDNFLPKGDVVISPFYTWVTTEFGRKDDRKRVNDLLKAAQELEEDPTSLTFEVTSFIKDEAYPGKGLDVKPRTIFPPNDKYLVASGPLAYGMGRYLKSVWHLKNHIHFTSGDTAVDLGDWYDYMESKLEDFVLIETDFSQFESRVTVEARVAVMDTWRKQTNLDSELQILLMQNKHVGRTREGLKWAREGGMSSAVADTCVTNSIINAMVHAAYLQSKSIGPESYSMLVLGDDNLLAVSRVAFERADRFADLSCFIMGYGLMPETKIHVDDYPRAEYCSGWFMGVSAPSGQLRHVWVPKLGRVLSKTFFVKPQHYSQGMAPSIVRGTAKGFLAGVVDPILTLVCASLLLSLGEGPIPDKLPTFSEYQPNLIDLAGHTPNMDDFMVRYDLHKDEVDTLGLYVVKAFTTNGLWPINFDTDACWPLDKIMIVDVPGFIEIGLESSGPLSSDQPDQRLELGQAMPKFDPLPPDLKLKPKRRPRPTARSRGHRAKN
jgi:hypothetical protein